MMCRYKMVANNVFVQCYCSRKVIPLQQEFLKKYFRFVLKNVEHKQLEKKVIITLF